MIGTSNFRYSNECNCKAKIYPKLPPTLHAAMFMSSMFNPIVTKPCNTLIFGMLWATKNTLLRLQQQITQTWAAQMVFWYSVFTILILSDTSCQDCACVRRPANRRALRSPSAPDLPEQNEPGLGLLHTARLDAGRCRMNSQHIEGSHSLRQPTSASKTLASKSYSAARMQIIIQADSWRLFF